MAVSALAATLSTPSLAAEARVDSARPAWPANHPTLCSDRQPLCVHAQDRFANELAATLRDLERVAFLASPVLAWPSPLPDAQRGGSPAFDVYLVPHDQDMSAVPDPPTDTRFLDQTSAFATLRPGLPAACYRPFVLAEAYARASLYGVDAAADDVLAHASAAYVASVVEPCLVAYGSSIDDFQTRPDLAISNDTRDRRGSMLFPWYLQETKGRGGPLDLLHAMWMVSAQPPSTNVALLHDEPDFLDAAATTARSEALPDMLLDFAVARAFSGARDDGLHFPTSRVLGALGAVRFEWSVPYGTLPRRLAPAHLVEPSGASYVWLDLQGVPNDASLSVRMHWEAPDVFRFAFVLVDDRGVAMARHDPVSPERGTELQWHIERLNGAVGMIAVVTNVGPTYKDIAFDPDVRPYTARSYTLELFAQ